MESPEQVLEAPESTPICSRELGEEQSFFRGGGQM